MQIIPAVDVRGGRTVRLMQGDYGRETVFNGEPVDIARGFIDAGARRIHVIDLDAARGEPDERSHTAALTVVATAQDAGCEAEVGGGVRTADAARAWLDAGAAYVVSGSVAARDPVLARHICETAPGRVLIALDVVGGEARAEGWTEAAGSADQLLASWNDWNAAGVIYTDTDRDGMMGGPDLEGLARCRFIYGGPVFLSGGVRSTEDAVVAAEHGAAGVVVGRALLQGAFDLREAIDAVGDA